MCSYSVESAVVQGVSSHRHSLMTLTPAGSSDTIKGSYGPPKSMKSTARAALASSEPVDWYPIFVFVTDLILQVGKNSNRACGTLD
jgi:hypothetical protein